MSLRDRLGDVISGGLWLRPALYLLFLITLISLAFAGFQTLRLAEARRALAAVSAGQTDMLNQLAAGTAATAERVNRGIMEFDRALAGITRAQKEAKEDATARHIALVGDITAGTRRVRQDWLSGCPATVPGEPTGPVGPSGTDPYRAAAIGRVLGIGADADIAYQTCRQELSATEALLATCFAEPAK